MTATATTNGRVNVVMMVNQDEDHDLARTLDVPTVRVPQDEWRPEFAHPYGEGDLILQAGRYPNALARRVWHSLSITGADVRTLDLDGFSGCGLPDLLRAAQPLPPEIAAGDPLADRLLNVSELLSQPLEPTPWRCDQLAADGFLSILTGRGGEGKSWLALTLASATRRGGTAAGIACEKGVSVYFDAENGRPLVSRRLRAAGITTDTAPEYYDCGELNFDTTAKKFEGAIRFHNAKLAVFDSLRAFVPGAKENESDDMAPLIRRFVDIARRTGCAVLLIHHRPKAADGAAYRGSSTIEDQCDLMFTLDRATGDPERRFRRFIKTVKCRIELEPERRWLEIRPDRERGHVTVDAAEPFEGDDERPTSKGSEAAARLTAALELGPYDSKAAWIRAAGGNDRQSTWTDAANRLVEEQPGLERDDGKVGWLVETPRPTTNQPPLGVVGGAA